MIIELLLSAALSSPLPVSPNVASGTLANENAIMLLHNKPGNCPSGKNRAIMILRKTGYYFAGCWKERKGSIEIEWDDGDIGRIKVNEVIWAPGHRPGVM